MNVKKCITVNYRRKSKESPRYSWNIIESGVKHHKPKSKEGIVLMSTVSSQKNLYKIKKKILLLSFSVSPIHAYTQIWQFTNNTMQF